MQVFENQTLAFYWVPGAGVEPAHPFGHWCLRPTRLPIPPSGLEDSSLAWDLESWHVPLAFCGALGIWSGALLPCGFSENWQ